MDSQLDKYIQLNKKMTTLRSQMKVLRTESQLIEKDLFNYMKKQNLNSLNNTDGKVVFTTKKVPEPLNEDNLITSLEQGNISNASKIAKSILDNKPYRMENKLKIVISD